MLLLLSYTNSYFFSGLSLSPSPSTLLSIFLYLYLHFSHYSSSNSLVSSSFFFFFHLFFKSHLWYLFLSVFWNSDVFLSGHNFLIFPAYPPHLQPYKDLQLYGMHSSLSFLFTSESMDHNSNLSLVSLLNSCAPLSVMSAWCIPNCGWLWAFSAVAPELLSSVGEKYRVRQINVSINTGPSPHLSSQHYPANLCHSLNNSLLHSPWQYTSPGASLASPSLCPPEPLI